MTELAPAPIQRQPIAASPSPLSGGSPSASSPKPILVAKSSPASESGSGNGGSQHGSATASAGVVKLQVKKKYVLPPRPKPGRKPSADTPLNKRKAQNREAQRAFRERRAVAIQDLEQKLNHEARRHASDYKNMTEMIQQLMQENEMLRNRMAQQPAPASFPPPMSPATSAMSPAQSPYDSSFSPSQFTYMMASSPAATTVSTSASAPVSSTIGRSPLDMLDKVLDEKLPDPQSPAKRSPESKVSPPRRPSIVAAVTASSKTGKPCGGPPPCEGLNLTNTDWAAPAVPLQRRLSSLETDFTQRFKSKQPRTLPRSPSYIFSPSPMSPDFARPPDERERCGFCTDNTPCVCAEAAARESANMSDIETLGDPLPSVTALPIGTASMHQTYSEPAPAQIGVRECTGNPGTCTQCQSDPMSTLFCATLAAKGAAAPANGTFIPAQAAYQTLSRHERFSQADFSQLVSSLQTRGTQVEVNSVAKVLRMLDGRLYSG